MLKKAVAFLNENFLPGFNLGRVDLMLTGKFGYRELVLDRVKGNPLFELRSVRFPLGHTGNLTVFLDLNQLFVGFRRLHIRVLLRNKEGSFH